MIDCFHGIYATITPLVISCQANVAHIVHGWVRWMIYIPPLIVNITYFYTMKAAISADASVLVQA